MNFFDKGLVPGTILTVNGLHLVPLVSPDRKLEWIGGDKSETVTIVSVIKKRNKMKTFLKFFVPEYDDSKYHEFFYDLILYNNKRNYMFMVASKSREFLRFYRVLGSKTWDYPTNK